MKNSLSLRMSQVLINAEYGINGEKESPHRLNNPGEIPKTADVTQVYLGEGRCDRPLPYREH